MVKLVIKKGDETQFLFESTVDTNVEEALKAICNIYNGRLKIQRLCSGSYLLNLNYSLKFILKILIEIEYLSKAGICLPYNMQGLTDEQISDLKLVDEWSEKCIPSGGYIEKKDELGRRNGRGMNSY